ncbi:MULTISPECIES: antitoxin [unclassified Moraxella]|uniref:antitoxin n=1 Tax=unclassified Moraxella TaxID=2685852 RepID=UPI003AF89732
MQINHVTQTTSKIGKVFKSGNSQAVRIPASFRLDTDQVKISQTEKGLLLEPILPTQEPSLDLSKGEAFLALFKGFPDDFIEAVAERDMSPPQEREPL